MLGGDWGDCASASSLFPSRGVSVAKSRGLFGRLPAVPAGGVRRPTSRGQPESPGPRRSSACPTSQACQPWTRSHRLPDAGRGCRQGGASGGPPERRGAVRLRKPNERLQLTSPRRSEAGSAVGLFCNVTRAAGLRWHHGVCGQREEQPPGNRGLRFAWGLVLS